MLMLDSIKKATLGSVTCLPTFFNVFVMQSASVLSVQASDLFLDSHIENEGQTWRNTWNR